MPLSEVPFNHARRNAQIGRPQIHTHEGRLRPQTPNGNENVNFMQKPSSIQSMLRNTTETGDVGQFSIKPSRVPTATSRPSPASSSKARNTPSKSRQPMPYYYADIGCNGLHGRMPSPNGSGSSSHGPRPIRGPHRAPSFEDYHSFSMTQSSYTSHGLNHRHPYGNGSHHSRTDLYNGRARSPFAYPTRLKRPGYRPSSPSLSELSKSYAQRSPGLPRDPSSRAASPSSGYYPTRTPSPWQYGFNRSDPMLHHYPSAMATGLNRARSPSLASTHLTTPKPSSSLKSVSSSSQLPRPRSGANLGRLHPQSQPPSPMFYDYTEGFDEQGEYTNMSVSTAILFEQSTPEAASNTYSEFDESPEGTQPAELPVDNSPPNNATQRKEHSSNQGVSRIESVGGGWIRATGQDLSDVLEMSEKDAPSDQGETRSEADHDSRNRTRFEHAFPRHITSRGETIVQQVLPYEETGVQQSQPELALNIGALTVSRASNNNSSPPTGSMVSAKPSPRLEETFLTPEPINCGPDTTPAPRLAIDASIVEAGTSATPIEVRSAHRAESVQGPSSEVHSRAEVVEILSPTPERSITSSIARDRFSKILSIDENHLGLDHIWTENKKEERIDSPMQEIRSCSTIPTAAEHPWWKRSSYFRDKPMQSSPASKVLVETSDSEDEPELTNALRATFCKTESPIPGYSEGSSLNTLPSQRSFCRSVTPLSIGRALAMRDSSTSPPTLQDTIPITPNKAVRAPSQSLAHKVSNADMKQPPPVDKELPPLPKERRSIVSYSPPAQTSPSALPFSFSPLAQKRREELTIAELEAVTSSYLAQEEKTIEPDESQSTQTKPKVLPKRKSAVSLLSTKLDLQSDRASAASPLSSRPWNLETSYPWDDQVPELEVKLPKEADDFPEPTEKFPRFKFRLQRASTLGGVARRRSKRMSDAENTSSAFGSSDIFPGPSFRQKKDLNMAVFPTNINSSHDILRSSLQRTRFVESFEEPSPTVKLIPPSPAQEVRSFFSDDSSLPGPKGSLRKRFSDFRARTSRAASMDQGRGYDRGLLSSAFGMSRASGRSSRQSERTAGASSRASRAKRARFDVVEKLKLWLFQPLEDRVRDWRWRIRYRRDRTRAATSTPLYAGV